LGPIAAAGLLIDWAVLHRLFPIATAAPAAELLREKPRRVDFAKPSVVVLLVLAGFLFGFPPALVAAVAAAVVLIFRSLDPHRIYNEVDWSLLVFFVGLFVIVGGAEKVGIVSRMLHFAQNWNLHNPAIFATVTAVMSNLVSNVPAVMLLKSLV